MGKKDMRLGKRRGQRKGEEDEVVRRIGRVRPNDVEGGEGGLAGM